MAAEWIGLPHPRRYGVVGGLGAIAGVDTLLKFIKASARMGRGDELGVVFEQQGFAGQGSDGDISSRKFYVYDTLRSMEQRGVEVALVPCFLSHTFLNEITPELRLSVVSLFDALSGCLARDYPECRRIGVLTSDYVKQRQAFEHHLGDTWQILYPREAVQADKLMQAIYGHRGIREGVHDAQCLSLLLEACLDLVEQGAEVIVPGFTEIPVLADVLGSRLPVPLIDSNAAYAEHALSVNPAASAKPFKVGVLGGVGPAATVDFMRKLIALTDARRDQDHLKLVIEQNPQIPDRTANLIADGDDPTIALLATCKKLEAQGADIVAIPCNTAHAYVDRIQKHLRVPIVNMLHEVMRHIRIHLPEISRVGLLATTGTVGSGVYRELFESQNYALLTPGAAGQERVMRAIYGDTGIKAGFTTGLCVDDLKAALDELVDAGAQVIVLGCTELPLVELDASDAHGLPLLDPTAILARRCVELSKAPVLAADEPRDGAPSLTRPH